MEDSRDMFSRLMLGWVHQYIKRHVSHLYPLKTNNEKGSQYYNVFYQFICSVANDAAVKCLSYSSETSPTVMFSIQNIRKPLAYYNGHLSIYRLSPPDSITTVRKLHSCLWLDG